jgi:choline dehydrogenase-like flavoprotein
MSMRVTETDVAVVGSGPTGAIAAWRLASAGFRVTILERGGAFDPAALRREDPDFEARRAGPLSANPTVRGGADDDVIDHADSPIAPMMAHGAGGTSPHWSAHVPRFRPEDFRGRSLDGAGADWPLRYGDLAPLYDVVEARWGTAFVPGDPTLPPRGGARPLPLPTLGAHGRRVAAAFDRLGWHWWPVDLVVGRDAAAPDTAHCDHVGPCDLGCPSRIRSAADRFLLADALIAGARLVPSTRVLDIETDARGATGLVCADANGTYRLRAAHVVLAANGSATPRLLFLSASGRHPNGLANRSGLLGRGLMLHPYAKVDAVFDEPLGSWVSGEKAGLISFEFARSDPSRGFRRGVKLQLVTHPGPLGLAGGAPFDRPLPWGAARHAAFEALFDHVLGMTVCAEDLPEDGNRVTLSDTLVDRDGRPAAKWTYRVPPDARAALDFGLDRAAEVLAAAGGRDMHRTSLRRQAGFHVMGTARMGANPETSVVGPFSRAHDVPNLTIADASVFVSSAVINPTATAQALALRAADHLVATRRDHGTSSRMQATA